MIELKREDLFSILKQNELQNLLSVFNTTDVKTFGFTLNSFHTSENKKGQLIRVYFWDKEVQQWNLATSIHDKQFGNAILLKDISCQEFISVLQSFAQEQFPVSWLPKEDQ